jgi:prevent-host-death family protein
MERVGVRELRQRASEILRRVEAGETIEITDRGRPVAVLVQVRRPGISKLESEGLLRRGVGGLLDVPRVMPSRGRPLPSERISLGRGE